MSRRTLLLLRWGVFLLACAFLFVRLSSNDAPISMEALGAVSAGREFRTLIAVVLGLMFVNWGLESRKWRLLVRDLEPISKWRAFIATIAGTPIGLITPNRVGEFVGRVLFLEPEHRIAASFATAVGSIAQFVVTVVLGLLGLIAMVLLADPDRVSNDVAALIGLCALVAGATVLLYFNPDLLRATVARLPVIKRWERHAAVLERFSTGMLTRVLVISALRYAVFTVQFALLLAVFARGLSWTDAIASIPATFLVATLIPTVMLTELGVRGSVAVALISPDSSQDHAVFLVSTALWLINLGLPALAGGIILLAARIRSARD